MSQLMFRATPEVAADAAAAALAEGMAPEHVGEAIALASNQLLLRDHGAPTVKCSREADRQRARDSIGVHAMDSTNAWRGMARAGSPRNTFASLVLAAYQTAFDRVQRGGDFLHWNRSHSRSSSSRSRPGARTNCSRHWAGRSARTTGARLCPGPSLR